MARRYVFRRRQNKIIYFETLFTAAIISFLGWKVFEYHWVYTIITFGVLALGFIYAFFEIKIFRYITTSIFSMAYGIIAYSVGRIYDNENFTTGVVLAFIAYIISIVAHKDHFDFLKNAELFEYERL